jgi:transcription termination/antitermination protein NusG
MTGYWYIIHIYSGHEKKVKVNLEQRVRALELQNEILQVVIPTTEVTEVKDGKRRTSERPSYPGYILVQTANELSAEAESEFTRQSWYVIRETPGVMNFVGSSGSTPTPLNEAEVQNILNLSTDEELQPSALTVDYVVGDQVKVIEGPFKGFPAEIKGVDMERQRLNLMISIFGRATPIEIEFFGVEKI